MSKQRSWKVVVIIAALALFACVCSSQAADIGGRLQGVVKNSSGAPVSGAFVKLINADRHLTYMVISQAQGRYNATNLIPGKYTAQGIGAGYQSESKPVDVAASKASTADLLLTTEQAPMLPAAWPDRQGANTVSSEAWRYHPEKAAALEKLPAGEGKRLIIAKCGQCHDVQRVVELRDSRANVEKLVQMMRAYAQNTTLRKDWTDQEGKTLIDYLAANIIGQPGGQLTDSQRALGQRATPKPDPNSRLPRTLLQGENARYIVVEYQIPGIGRDPHEVTLDPRGNAWVSERIGGKLGKLDVSSLSFSEIDPPPASEPVHLSGIVKGAGDKLWMNDGPNRRVLEFDSKTSEFTAFEVPKLKWGLPTSHTMRVHPDGSIWISGNDSNTIIGLNPSTKKFVVYDVPAGLKLGRNATPYGMAIDGAGNIWWAEEQVDQMGRLDPATGKIDEFPIPNDTNARLIPRKVGYDKDGNIWVGLHSAGELAKIDYKTTKMTIYSPPTKDSGVYSIWGDMKSGLLWFSEQQVDKMARFDPRTEKFTEFPLPYAETDARKIEIDPNNPNRIWYTGSESNRIGYIQLLDGNGQHQ